MKILDNSFRFFTLASLVLLTGCALGISFNPTPTITPSTATVTAPPPSPTMEIPTATAVPATETPLPLPTDVVDHVYPSVPFNEILTYDSESKSTSLLEFAGNGDIYELNRFERPFDSDMFYLPNFDILSFSIASDTSYFYATIRMEDLSTSFFTPKLQAIYAVTVDYDLDGRGDFLIQAAPPFKRQWTIEGIKIFQDVNRDVGGRRPGEIDQEPGDGFEQLIWDSGTGGNDPDLAWVRTDPIDWNLIQFAFKKSLIATNYFELAAWVYTVDNGPARFNINDHLTEAEAGSPLIKDVNYPLKALYAIDSTCYIPYGTINGFTPLTCSPIQVITPTKTPNPKYHPNN